eukprot:2785824-Pyramimonas_sp.AAC.1
MDFSFSGSSLPEVLERLEEMELLIKEYDDLASPDELADDVIVSVVMKTIPEPMKTHFDLDTHLCETYEDLKREIHKYVGIK